MENFNNQFRKKVFEKMPINFEEAIIPISLYSELLYEICANPDNEEEYIYRNLILSTICLDAYKIYNYKSTTSHLSEKERKSYDKLNRYIKENSFESILLDKLFFKKCLLQSYRFYNLPTLDKILIFKCLTEEQHKELTSVIPNHILDKDEYDILLSPEVFKNEINKMLRKSNIGMIRYVANYIRRTNVVSEEIIDSILKEIIKSDYKMSDYYTHILNKDIDKQLAFQFEEILHVLKQNDFETYKNLYFANDSFLADAVQSYLILNTDYKDPDKEEIMHYVNSNNYDEFDFDKKEKVKEKNEL